MKVLIADDHPMIHRGLSYLIKDNFHGVEIDTVFDGDDMLSSLGKLQYDILVLDINMPGFSFQSFEKLVADHPSLKVVVYSQSPEKQFALRYMKGGALAFVEKTKPDEVMVSALKSIIAGHKYYSPEVMDHLTEQLQGKRTENPFQKLSNREFDVANLLLKGMSFNEISNMLHISPSTVSTYKLRIFDKLNIDNLVDFVEVARSYGIK